MSDKPKLLPNTVSADFVFPATGLTFFEVEDSPISKNPQSSEHLNAKGIGGIQSTECSGLVVRKHKGKYQWAIEEHWGCHDWADIPKTLYNALIEFETERMILIKLALEQE